MDISSEDPSPSGQMLLAVRYRSVMNLLKRLKDKNGYPIESVTLWGVHDGQTWLTNASRTCYPLLFDHKLTPKSAFFGAILDDSIPKSAFEEDIRSALEVLNITD